MLHLRLFVRLRLIAEGKSPEDARSPGGGIEPSEIDSACEIIEIESCEILEILEVDISGTDTLAVVGGVGGGGGGVGGGVGGGGVGGGVGGGSVGGSVDGGGAEPWKPKMSNSRPSDKDEPGLPVSSEDESSRPLSSAPRLVAASAGGSTSRERGRQPWGQLAVTVPLVATARGAGGSPSSSELSGSIAAPGGRNGGTVSSIHARSERAATAAPGTAAPGAAAPGAAAPGTAAPGTAAPGTAAPGTIPLGAEGKVRSGRSGRSF